MVKTLAILNKLECKTVATSSFSKLDNTGAIKAASIFVKTKGTTYIGLTFDLNESIML